MTRLLYRRDEAAELLAMSPDHYRANVEPCLRIVRSGRLRLVPATELERWVREQQGFAG